MKKVCLFNYREIPDFHGYQLETFDPMSFPNPKDHWSFTDLVAWGLNGYRKRRALTATISGIDRLYRERDRDYLRMVDAFVERFANHDMLIMSTFNFIHPEVLATRLTKPLKVLGFIDDPLSTYSRGIAQLWAFDAAFWISPSYIDDLRFEDAFKRWSSIPACWWPLVPWPLERPEKVDDGFFANRSVDVMYVGNPTASKVDRLIEFKKHFGERFKVHGRWPFRGWSGVIRGAFGKPIYPHRVSSLSNEDRTALYWDARIGLNMHVSDEAFETGNVRMYETPAHGAMMICDRAGAGAHDDIFREGVEAQYYDTTKEAIELIEHYLVHEEERQKIAKAGFERFWRDYEWEHNLLRFLRWCDEVNDARDRSPKGEG